MSSGPRRGLSVPAQPTYRLEPTSPQSAPPVPNGTSSRIGQGASLSVGANSPSPLRTNKRRFAPPVRKRSMPIPARSTHPLQKEIERLTAVCEEHERTIRSSLSTLKHHLLTNLPDIFERLNKCDDDAETVTATIQQTLQANIPPFQSHLSKIISDRKADVDLMRQRTTPWKDIVSETLDPPFSDDNDTKNSVVDGGFLDGGGERLKRVPGADGQTGMDALTKVEMWADELDMYLSTEIVRLKERVDEKDKKWRFLARAMRSTRMVISGTDASDGGFESHVIATKGRQLITLLPLHHTSIVDGVGSIPMIALALLLVFVVWPRTARFLPTI
ncbi:hypothetical protein I317_03154 [Kwoniella heveanensis CBS 569]|nr:hypothetical protein I317_03154 [Kwoniella heveanensis CBS 569]